MAFCVDDDWLQLKKYFLNFSQQTLINESLRSKLRFQCNSKLSDAVFWSGTSLYVIISFNIFAVSRHPCQNTRPIGQRIILVPYKEHLLQMDDEDQQKQTGFLNGSTFSNTMLEQPQERMIGTCEIHIRGGQPRRERGRLGYEVNSRFQVSFQTGRL